MTLTTDAALERLREGNRRFVAGAATAPAACAATRRAELAERQSPWAVVLGCADSRVPPELIFDQGLGELFVIRVAGNIAGSTQVESVEFAVEQLGCRLVVVLGHTNCGAVKAAIELCRNTPAHERDPGSVIAHVGTTIESVLHGRAADQAAHAEFEAIQANVRATVLGLTARSGRLARRRVAGELAIVGAWYAIDSGRVEFLDRSLPRIRPARVDDLPVIRRLLDAEGLPSSDVEEQLEGFVVIDDASGTTVAAGGLEWPGPDGVDALLRSVVVDPDSRRRGLAAAICDRLERAAAERGAHAVYLLTEHSETFFARRGYATVSRAEVPAAIRSTAQFAGLCPESALVMRTVL